MNIAIQQVQQIVNTREFIELKEARKNIGNNPQLKQQVDVFQKKQIEIMSRARSPQEAEEMLARLGNEIRGLSQNPEFNTMIKAGERFNQMMLNLNKEVNETLVSYLQY